jgi:transposase InsO family protein
MCQVLDVSRSGYYAWLHRAPSPRERQAEQLCEQIRQVHARSRERYGSPRVHRELAAQGLSCCENTVAKLMRKCGIRSKMCRKFRVHTTDSRHPHPVAPNKLDQQFTQDKPNRAWVADITYIPTGEGWLYLAAVLDLYSRKVVGWATADHLRASLACEALQAALASRRPTESLLHHSDRGVQYACDEYQELLAKHSLEVSMSRTGNCYDNAVMESFFGTLKMELVHHEDYATRHQAHQSLFEYIEIFYNRQRRHSALNYTSPLQFENQLT